MKVVVAVELLSTADGALFLIRALLCSRDSVSALGRKTEVCSRKANRYVL